MFPMPGMVTADYNEPLRPQFHFTAKSGWLNDPNGLVFFKGEYHMFFQHNPFGTGWGNMTWGHAVSKDLIHWKQIENAIEPDQRGTIFSGSAVIDPKTSGLACFYTAAGGTNDASKGQPFTQCLVTSQDGRTFSKSPANPVIKHIVKENRDPKVIWDQERAQWVMALYLDGNDFALFSSKNLTDWTKLSNVHLDGATECPDFYPLRAGRQRKQEWVFTAANGRYQIGEFDGTTFTPKTATIPLNFGNTSYAGQTFFNDPKGRRIQITWLNNSEFPKCAWNQQMSFPMEVKLLNTAKGPRLSYLPIEEIKALRDKRLTETNGAFKAASGLYDFNCTLTVPQIGTFKIQIGEVELSYDAAEHTLKALGKTATIEPEDGLLNLRILVDRASIEIYAQSGTVLMPLYALQTKGTPQIQLTKSGSWKERIDVWALKSSW